jgi:Na+-driven multidrug efflux pump
VKLKDYLFLPAEITPFERAHLARTHSVAWWFFVALQPIAAYVFALDGVLLGAGDAAYLAIDDVAAGAVERHRRAAFDPL